MSGDKAAVLGANGFLGSHLTRRLVKTGREVRAMIRPGRELNPNIRGLDIEVVHGDALDRDSLLRAMHGCATVFHCIVDPRAWLHDSTPLFQNNVDGLRNSMEAALEVGVTRFVFLSTVCTIGLNPSGVASEADAFNWDDRATDYVRSRVQAEDLFTDYCRTRGLPGVACNVAMTWGAGDVQPTAQGALLRDVVRKWQPAYWDSYMSSVGIDDAAEAMILAEQRGRIGERYIIATRLTGFREVFDIGARHAGKRPPWLYLPMPLLKVIALVSLYLARILDREMVLTPGTLRLAQVMKDFDNSKARTELGWQPGPLEESIREAVDWFRQHS